MASLQYVVFMGLLAAVLASDDWGYIEAQGDILLPGDWDEAAAACGGDAQSPINIEFDCVVDGSADGTDMVFTAYDDVTPVYKISNTGHSIKVEPDMDTAPDQVMPQEISGSGAFPTGRSYRFAQFHVHWGVDDTMGSEHTIDDMSYPMEMHLVHYDSQWSSLTEALTSGDGDAVAVLGVMFEIDDSGADNALVQTMIMAASSIENHDDGSISFDAIALNDLLPTSPQNQFRYKGSLTTPTCNEAVQWTLFDETLKVTSAQMATLRSSFNYADGETLVTNHRPVHPRNGRAVTRTFSDTDRFSVILDTDDSVCYDGASSLQVSLLVVAIASVLAVLNL